VSDHLSEEEYNQLIKDIESNEAAISVSRSLARQFFANVGNKNVRELTGKSLIWKKLIINSMLLISVLLILVCLGLLIQEFGWGALVAVPLTGIFWTILAGFTTELGSWIVTISTYVFIMVIAPLTGTSYMIPMMLFATSLLLYRVAHILAQSFLTGLVVDSYDAYDMLSEHITLSRPELSRPDAT
jgi:hypothetical protein